MIISDSVCFIFQTECWISEHKEDVKEFEKVENRSASE